MQAGQRVQFVQGVGVERVAGGHDQRAVVPRDRHQVLAVNQLQRHRREHVRRDRDQRKIDQFQPEFLGQNREQLLFLDEAFIDERLVRWNALGGRDCVRGTLAVRFRKQPTIDERLEKLHGSWLGRRNARTLESNRF